MPPLWTQNIQFLFTLNSWPLEPSHGGDGVMGEGAPRRAGAEGGRVGGHPPSSPNLHRTPGSLNPAAVKTVIPKGLVFTGLRPLCSLWGGLTVTPPRPPWLHHCHVSGEQTSWQRPPNAGRGKLNLDGRARVRWGQSQQALTDGTTTFYVTLTT